MKTQTLQIDNDIWSKLIVKEIKLGFLIIAETYEKPKEVCLFWNLIDYFIF